jgi:hypothetical protein
LFSLIKFDLTLFVFGPGPTQPSANSNQIRCDIALFEDKYHPGLHALFGRYVSNQNRSQIGIKTLFFLLLSSWLARIIWLNFDVLSISKKAKKFKIQRQASLYSKFKCYKPRCIIKFI